MTYFIDLVKDKEVNVSKESLPYNAEGGRGAENFGKWKNDFQLHKSYLIGPRDARISVEIFENVSGVATEFTGAILAWKGIKKDIILLNYWFIYDLLEMYQRCTILESIESIVKPMRFATEK